MVKVSQPVKGLLDRHATGLALAVVALMAAELGLVAALHWLPYGSTEWVENVPGDFVLAVFLLCAICQTVQLLKDARWWVFCLVAFVVNGVFLGAMPWVVGDVWPTEWLLGTHW